METSAITGEGINEAFEFIIREIVKDIEDKKNIKKVNESFDVGAPSEKTQKKKKGCKC